MTSVEPEFDVYISDISGGAWVAQSLIPRLAALPLRLAVLPTSSLGEMLARARMVIVVVTSFYLEEHGTLGEELEALSDEERARLVFVQLPDDRPLPAIAGQVRWLTLPPDGLSDYQWDHFLAALLEPLPDELRPDRGQGYTSSAPPIHDDQPDAGNTPVDETLDDVSPDIRLPDPGTPASPSMLRLDTAVPNQVVIGAPFDLAVSIRQMDAPQLSEADLPRLASGEVTVLWPAGSSFVRLRLEIAAPLCEIVGDATSSFILPRGHDSPIFYFQLIPRQTGPISILVKLYQEQDWLGSARVNTAVREKPSGQVEVLVASQPVGFSAIDLAPFTISAVDRGGGRYYVRGSSGAIGDAEAEIDVGLLRSTVAQAVQTLADSQRLAPGLSDFPRALYEQLFAGSIAEKFAAMTSLSDRSGQRFPLVLDFSGAPDLVDWPWELMLHPSRDFLALSRQTPLLRAVTSSYPDGTFRLERPLSLLVIVSSPADEPPLDVQAEMDALKEALPVAIPVTWSLSGTLSEAQQLLQSARPSAMHFIGHGTVDSDTGEGQLLFCSQDGSAVAVTAGSLKRLVSGCDIEMVFLNGCETGRVLSEPWSTVAASLVRQGITNVVAMQFPITDQDARLLTRSFYNALSSGLNLGEAMVEARLSLNLERPGSFAWATPVVYVT